MTNGTTYTGVVEGNSIQLKNAKGLVQSAKVVVTVLNQPPQKNGGMVSGAFAEHPELDEAIKKIIESRKHDTRRELDNEFHP